MKKETLKAVLIDEIIEYFTNSINTETLITNAFKKTVSPEDEKKYLIYLTTIRRNGKTRKSQPKEKRKRKALF